MISDYVPNGKENAVSRDYLAEMTGAEERAIRRELKYANERLIVEEGVVIISTSSKKGYWKTDDLAELEAYEREQTHRAEMIFENLKPVRALINRIKERDQVKLEG